MNEITQGLKGFRADDTLEVHPDSDGWLVLDGGAVVGKLEIDGGEMRFKWSSSTSVWPASFTLKKPAGESVPSLPVTEKYEHQTFSGGSGSHDVSGCDYEIKDGSNIIGWMKVNGSDTTWYGHPSYVSGGYLVFSGDSVEFQANTATGNESAYKMIDDVI